MQSNFDKTFPKSFMDERKKKAFYSGLSSEAVEGLEKEEINVLKRRLCKRLKLKEVPSNAFAIAISEGLSKEKRKSLSTKPTRTLSGVAPIAVMTKPIACRHGACSYCPGGPKSFFGNMPQSYTGLEPATRRAVANNFDPYLQAINRLAQYTATGHSVQKAEIIVMGGTFPSFPKKYKKEFAAYCFKALNDFSQNFFRKSLQKEETNFLEKSLQELREKEFNGFFGFPRKHGGREAQELRKKILKIKGKADLGKEQERNESANCRAVAMCIETRPDYCKKKHISEMLGLGATRVELGVQSVLDASLKAVQRGHSVEESIEATRLLKDSAFKVTYHIMPGLPESSAESDVEMFRQLFENPEFKPDSLKIYPCMVVPGTKLYRQWKQGKFESLGTEQAAEIIAEIKCFVPRWCRIQRIQRDISSNAIAAGVKKTNLRQIVGQKMKEKNMKCNCIRCREIGLKGFRQGIPKESEVKIFKEIYDASKGTEIFISAEDLEREYLHGFCRLRIPFNPFRKEISEKTALVRELHVFGQALPLAGHSMESAQHKGIGKNLMMEAEEIAVEYGKNKVVVISGVGVREYYRGLGYNKDGFYVSKKLG